MSVAGAAIGLVLLVLWMLAIWAILEFADRMRARRLRRQRGEPARATITLGTLRGAWPSPGALLSDGARQWRIVSMRYAWDINRGQTCEADLVEYRPTWRDRLRRRLALIRNRLRRRTP